MTANLFIAADWGTSNLRLYLCQISPSGDLYMLDQRSGPGVSQVSGDFEAVFFELVGCWIEERGPVPVIISGMAGSTLGWKDAAYIDCPADLANISGGGLRFEARGLDILIMSGLKVKNPLGAPDLMRGEELQLLGWLQANPVDDDEARLFALPGTHNKWVLLKRGRVETFLTALTGELFALLRRHSVLIGAPDDVKNDEAAFLQGFAAAENLGDAELLHALFATRSQQVVGEMTPTEATAYLSGLLIGSDTIGAMNVFRKQAAELSSVNLIGEPRLCEYYRLALAQLGISSSTSDPSDIALAGYQAVFRHLYL